MQKRLMPAGNPAVSAGRLGRATRAQAALKGAFRRQGTTVPMSLASKRPSKEPEWLKDIDVSRTVENLLTGAVVFVGKLPATAWWLLVRPSKLDRRLLYDSSLKSVPQVNATRPLTFLAVNLFFYVVLMLTDIGEVAPISIFLSFFKSMLAKIPTDFKSLSIESVSTFMLPGVLIVGLIATTTTWIAKLARRKASFKVMLNLHAYYVGLGCFIIAVQGLLLTPEWELISWGEDHYGKDHLWYALPLVASGFGFVAAVLVGAAQFVRCVREALTSGFAATLCILVSAWPTGVALAWLVVYFLSPAIAHIGK